MSNDFQIPRQEKQKLIVIFKRNGGNMLKKGHAYKLIMKYNYVQPRVFMDNDDISYGFQKQYNSFITKDV